MTDSNFSIEAKSREIFGKKTKNLRNAGQVPAVVYGYKIEPKALAVDAKEFIQLYKDAGETNLIDLKVEGEKSPMKVLVKDIDVHHVKRKVLHVSFYKVNMDEEIDTIVPIEFVGASLAEKDGAIIVHSITEIEVRCLPSDLPDHVEIDITALAEVGNSLTLKDIKLPKGVKILKDEDEMNQVIVSATAPLTEEQEKALEEQGGAPVAEVETTEQGETVEEGAEGAEGTEAAKGTEAK